MDEESPHIKIYTLRVQVTVGGACNCHGGGDAFFEVASKHPSLVK